MSSFISNNTLGQRKFLCYVMQGGARDDKFPDKKHILFNIISVMMGWVGVNFPEKTVCMDVTL